MMIKLIYLLFTLVAQSELLVIADDNHFVGHNGTKDPTAQEALTNNLSDPSEKHVGQDRKLADFTFYVYEQGSQGEDKNGATRKHRSDSIAQSDTTIHTHENHHHHHHEHHHHYNAVSSNEGRGSNIGVADNLRIGSNDYDHVRKDDSIDTNDSRSHQDSSSDSRSGSYGSDKGWRGSKSTKGSYSSGSKSTKGSSSGSYGWGKGWHGSKSTKGSYSSGSKSTKGSSSGSYGWGKGWHGSKSTKGSSSGSGSNGDWGGYSKPSKPSSPSSPSGWNGGWGGHSKPTPSKPSPSSPSGWNGGWGGHSKPTPSKPSPSSPSGWSGGWGGRSGRSHKSSNEEYRNSYGESNDDTRVVKEGSSRIPDSLPTSGDRSSVASNSSITSGNSRINQNATVDTAIDDTQTDNITKKPTRNSFPFTPSPSSETANDMTSGSIPTNTTTNITSNSSNARVPASFIYSSPTIVSNRTDTSTKPPSSVNATQGL